jgi:hypothetical protein
MLSTFTFAEDLYVRPAGGAYGAEDGSDYDNAFDGLMNVTWGDGAGNVGPSDTLWVAGLHIGTYTGAGNIALALVIDPVSGTSDANRVTIRGDYLGDPGTIWTYYYDTSTVWSDETGGVWSWTITSSIKWLFIFENITNDSWTILDNETSLVDCESNAGSYYSATYGGGTTLYVHTTDGLSPTDPSARIAMSSHGYKFRIAGMEYITLKNIKLYGHSFGGSVTFNDATHITFDGITQYYVASSRGFGPVDGNDYIKLLNSEIAYMKNGYYSSSGTDYGPRYFTLSGNYFHDIGTGVTTDDSDAHAVGAQGGTGSIVEFNNFVNIGTGPVYYSFLLPDMTNHIIRYNKLKDMYTAGAARGWGIAFFGDNHSYGDLSGNEIYGNLIDTTSSICIRALLPDQIDVFNNTCIDTDEGILASRSATLVKIDTGTVVIESLVKGDVLIGETSNAGLRVHSIRLSGAAPNAVAEFTYGLLYQVDFTSGGTAEVVAGDILDGASSAVACNVRRIDTNSGAWGDGDAAGTFWTGGSGLDANEDFDKRDGQANILTITGTEGSRISIEGEDVEIDGTTVGNIDIITHLGPNHKLRNNIVYHSGTPDRHVGYDSSATLEAYGKIDAQYNAYFPDGEYFRQGGFDRTWAFWKAVTVPAGSDYDSANSTSGTDPALNADGTPDGTVTLTGEDQGDYLLLACEAEFKTGAAPGYFPLLNPDRWGWPKGFCINVALNTSSGL